MKRKLSEASEESSNNLNKKLKKRDPKNVEVPGKYVKKFQTEFEKSDIREFKPKNVKSEIVFERNKKKSNRGGKLQSKQKFAGNPESRFEFPGSKSKFDDSESDEDLSQKKKRSKKNNEQVVAEKKLNLKLNQAKAEMLKMLKNNVEKPENRGFPEIEDLRPKKKRAKKNRQKQVNAEHPKQPMAEMGAKNNIEKTEKAKLKAKKGKNLSSTEKKDAKKITFSDESESEEEDLRPRKKKAKRHRKKRKGGQQMEEMLDMAKSNIEKLMGSAASECSEEFSKIETLKQGDDMTPFEYSINRFRPKMEPDPQKLCRTLFVGNLPFSITEMDLQQLFEPFGPVVSTQLIGAGSDNAIDPQENREWKKEFRRPNSGPVAYVVFQNVKDAERALTLNGHKIERNHITVDRAKAPGEKMIYDPKHSIFIGNLPFDIDNDTIWNEFAEFGIVQNVRVARDRKTGDGKGYGFVLFKHKAGKEKALTATLKIRGRTIRIKSVDNNHQPQSSNGMQHSAEDKQKPNVSKGLQHSAEDKQKPHVSKGIQHTAKDKQKPHISKGMQHSAEDKQKPHFSKGMQHGAEDKQKPHFSKGIQHNAEDGQKPQFSQGGQNFAGNKMRRSEEERLKHQKEKRKLQRMANSMYKRQKKQQPEKLIV